MSSFLLKFLPGRCLTSFAGWLANCRIRWIKNRLIQYFLWRYPVNMTETLKKDPYQYTHFNDFFTRQLHPSARTIASEPEDVVSPADGKLCQFGNIIDTQMIQAKDHSYSVLALLGNDQEHASAFMNGTFLTIYLAPVDYHRVHMPLDGTVTQMRYIPGTLFSVNEKTAACTPNLFARNERVVTLYNTAIGKVAVIMVGAMIVGSIETVWAGTITPPRTQNIQTWKYDHPIHLKRGEEMGLFKLGSTVILLFEQNKMALDPLLTHNQSILMGQRIGSLIRDQQ